jgi:small subunit ribosomal protein S3e
LSDHLREASVGKETLAEEGTTFEAEVKAEPALEIEAFDGSVFFAYAILEEFPAEEAMHTSRVDD